MTAITLWSKDIVSQQSGYWLSSNEVGFDLVQPLAAGRQLVGVGWEARRDEAGRQGACTQHNAHS